MKSLMARLALLLPLLTLPMLCTAEEQEDDPVAAIGLTSSFAEINGIKMHYVEGGQGETMLFLHGYPFFWYGWANLLEEFSKTHRVVAPDNRGYHLTDKPQEVSSYHISNLALDVSQLIEKVVPQNKVILVGHDWGGVLAWSVAQKYPEQISKVIVFTTPPYNVFLDMLENNPEQRKATAYMDVLKSGQVEKHFAKVGPDMFWQYGFFRLQEKGLMTELDKQRYWKAWSTPQFLPSALNWYRANVPALDAIKESDYWPSKDARIPMPSLLIWTDGERVFIPQTPQEVQKVADDLTLVELSDSGHSPFLDKPAEVIMHMRAFLTP